MPADTDNPVARILNEASRRGASAVLVAGPTASGKSALALALARATGGAIVNADAMQVYDGLRVLTARPTAAEEAEAEHRLYGHVPPATRYSVGRWLADMRAVLTDLRARGVLPIVAGGTGLYFKGLTEGLSQVPPIPAEIRERLAGEAAALGAAALHERLAAADPDGAAAVRPTDTARVLRALEVMEATGRPLATWQRGEGGAPLVDPAAAVRVVLDPDRAELHRRIATRAEHMLHGGALAEVAALAALGLDPDLPAMKAIGVRELLAHDRGDLSLDEALAAMKTATRRYAKRQVTWFRHQMADWTRVQA